MPRCKLKFPLKVLKVAVVREALIGEFGCNFPNNMQLLCWFCVFYFAAPSVPGEVIDRINRDIF